jgi:hypothetical protein
MFFQNYETLRLHILNSCFQIPKFLKPSSITNTEDHILRNLPCVNYILKPIVSNSNSYLASFHSLACHSILMFSFAFPSTACSDNTLCTSEMFRDFCSSIWPYRSCWEERNCNSYLYSRWEQASPDNWTWHRVQIFRGNHQSPLTHLYVSIVLDV